MTYDPTQPAANQSPSLFPPRGVDNFTRLQTLINVDHKFNNTQAPDDGWHKVIHYITQSPGTFGDNTPTPQTGVGIQYTKTLTTTGTSGSTTEHLFYHQGTGGVATNESCVSVWPVRAAAIFTVGAGPTFTVTPNIAFNVSSIVRNSLGVYTLTFPVNMPSINYAVLFTTQRSSNIFVHGQVVVGLNLVGSVVVIFYDSSSASIDPTMATITIMGG